MAYGDEEVISARIALLRNKENSIDRAATIDGVDYSFSQREFPLGFSMIVPNSFETLAPKLARIKYPYEDRPQIIIASESSTVSFAFDQSAITPETLEERIIKYRSIIKRLHPCNVFYEQNIYEQPDGNRVACYDFRSQAIDTDIYNLNFFSDINHMEIYGWFNCPVDQREKWEPLVREMVQSLQATASDER